MRVFTLLVHYINSVGSSSRTRCGIHADSRLRGNDAECTHHGLYNKVLLCRRKTGLVATVVILFTVFFSISFFTLDPDFGWHLQSGRYYLEHGIPEHDIFTYTASDFRWINSAWLHDVIVAALYQVGGYTTLSILFSALAVLSLIIASRSLYPPALLASSLALLSYFGIRGSVWTLVLFTVLERLLEAKKGGTLFLIPLVFLFWSNVHGGFVLGLSVLILTALSRRQVTLTISSIAAVCATFINPYGPALYTEIWRTVVSTPVKLNIIEWQPLFLHAPTPSLSFLALLAVTLWMRHRGSITLKSFLNIPSLLLLLSVSATRHIPLFALSVSRYLEKDLEWLIRSIPSLAITAKQIFHMPLVLPVIVLVVFNYAGMALNLDSNREKPYPVQAVEYLHNHPCPGNIFNSYNYGGVLIWRLPERRVYIDGRMTFWQNDDGMYYFDVYRTFFNDASFRKREIQKHNIRCILIEQTRASGNDAFITDLQKDGWRIVFTDNESESVLLTFPEPPP